MIVLYNPVSSAGRKPILPIACLSLGAVIEGKWPWAIVDGNLEADPIARIDALLAEGGGPKVLGVTAMPGPQLRDAVPVMRAIKRRHPDVNVVMGGYFATQHWRTCMEAPFVDAVVRGHGEPGFVAWLASLDGGDPASVPGLVWRGPDGLVANAMPAVPKPAELPPLPLHRVPVSRYVRPTVLGRRTLGYHSSYGCPYVCNFCAVVSLVNGRWSAQPAERVADVFRDWRRRWRIDAVELYDNNFFVGEARCRAFADAIDGLGVAWWGEGRIDTLLRFSDDTWRAMRRSGLRMVFMGAESGSAETLARMDKGGTLRPEDTLALVERMAGFDVIPELSFVLGAPPDPAADVEQTLEFVRRVKEKNPRTEIILYLYTPEPVEGALYDDAQAAGFRWPPTLEAWADPAWEDVIQRRGTSLPWFPEPLRRKVRDFERVLNARYPTSTDPRLTGARRRVLSAAAAWRWETRRYGRPWELDVMQKLLRYQRPETSGF